MRVLVCGSRDWEDGSIVATVLTGLLAEVKAHLDRLVIIEGCARGADLCAHYFAAAHVFHEHYPAEWEHLGKQAGFVRNRQMLEEGKPDLVLAFRSEGVSKGTDMMIDLARRAGVRTYVIQA